MGNYNLKEMAQGMGDGKKTLYPKMQTYSMHDFDTVMKHMQTYESSLSKGMIMSVMDALARTMTSWMPMGHTIKIDGLGVFSLRLGFDTSMPSESEAAASNQTKQKYRHVCIKGINFKPDAQLIEMMNKEANFERSEREVVVPRKKRYTQEQRLTIARQLIERNGSMTLTDYALATEQERSVASRDLKRLVASPQSGITSRGGSSHKVWVKSE